MGLCHIHTVLRKPEIRRGFKLPQQNLIQKERKICIFSHEHETIHQDLTVYTLTLCMFCKVWMSSFLGGDRRLASAHPCPCIC